MRYIDCLHIYVYGQKERFAFLLWSCVYSRNERATAMYCAVAAFATLLFHRITIREARTFSTAMADDINLRR